jgi:hypothetical protein
MRSLEAELEARVEQGLVPHLQIFHQQVTDFPIHRRSEMLLPIEELDHCPADRPTMQKSGCLRT